jgi:circadian clock protein KaiC
LACISSVSSAEKPGLYFGFAEPCRASLPKAAPFPLPIDSLAESGAVEFVWQPAAEGLIDELAARVLTNVKRRGREVVFIDRLDGFHQASAEPGGYVFTALVTEFRALGVTSIYSAESAELLDVVPRPPRLEPQFTFGLSTIAENILLLRVLERRSKLHRLISIAKVRDASFDPEIREYSIKDRGIVVDEDASAANALLSDTVPPRPRRKPALG